MPRAKPCEVCQSCVTIRYRIIYQKDVNWTLVCSECWCRLARDNPHYRYGGTWKAKRS